MIKTVLTILALLISGALYVMVVVSRVSVRVNNAERDIRFLTSKVAVLDGAGMRMKQIESDVEILENHTKELKEKTSFEHLEKVTKKVMLQVIHSKDFKDAIRDVLIHIDKNRTSAETGVFSAILDEIKELKKDNAR